MNQLSFASRSAVLAPRTFDEEPGIPYEVLEDTAAITTLSRAAIDAHDDYRIWWFTHRACTLVNDTGFPYASAK